MQAAWLIGYLYYRWCQSRLQLIVSRMWMWPLLEGDLQTHQTLDDGGRVGVEGERKGGGYRLGGWWQWESRIKPAK